MPKQTFCSLSLCWHTFSASWENGLWTFGGRNSARPRAFRQSMKSLVRRIIAMATGHGQLISSKVYYNTEDSQTYSGNICTDTVCSPRYIGTCTNNPWIKDTPLLGTLSNYNTGLFSYVTGHMTECNDYIWAHDWVQWLYMGMSQSHGWVQWLYIDTWHSYDWVQWLYIDTWQSHGWVQWIHMGMWQVTWLSAMAIYGLVTVTWLSAMANPNTSPHLQSDAY